MCGVSRQAIHDAVKKGVIDQEGEGRKSRIDLEAYKTIQYQKNNNCQRKGPAENLSRRLVKKIPEKIGILPVDDDIIKEHSDSVSITVPKNNGNEVDIDELLEIARRLEVAKTEKMEQQALAEKLKNASRRGELINRERFYDIIKYLDKLHSNIERLADSFLSDVGGRIIDSGKINPEHRSIWKDEVMSQIDVTKKDMVRELKEIEKEQAL